MENKIKDLIDLEEINRLLEGFNKVTGFVTAILDLEGNVLSQSGWRSICTEFHREHPVTSKRCTASDTLLANKMDFGIQYHAYKCLNGLIDVAVPLIIKGEHVANLFSGQFFFEEPDIEFFRKQAKEFGFNEKEYIRALKKVPVVDEDKVKISMDFLLNMTEFISELGFQKQELAGLNLELEESGQNLRAANQELLNKNRQLETSEKALKDSETRWQFAVDGSSLGLWDWDIKTDEIFFSNQWKGMLGYDEDEVSGTIDERNRLIHQDDKDSFFTDIRKHLEGETELYINEHRVLCKNKSYKWIMDRGKVISRTDEGEPLRMIGTHTDITERKEAEEEYIRLSTAVQQSPSIIAITDNEGIIQYVNPKFTEVTGFSLEETLGENLIFLISSKPSEFKIEDIWASLSEKGFWHDEIQKQKKNGNYYWESISLSPILDNRSNIINYVMVAEDITEKKKNEIELQKSESMKGLGKLAGGIAHDFNNILSGIYGNVSLAIAKMEKNHPALKYLMDTNKSMDRATKLTRQLLTFSKGGSPEFQTVNLGRIIKETVLFDLSGSNIKPVFQFEKNLNDSKVDSGQIQQVFSNLTINAKQATPEGGCIYIKAENYVLGDNNGSNLKPGNYIKIRFRDEGCGIPDHYIERIFDPYFTTKEHGTGLGLATTFSIIKQHKGAISLESELGKGTIFTLYLPAAKKKSAHKVQQELKKEPLEARKTARILIMDDEEILRKMTSRMLHTMGYETVTSSDGKEAVIEYKRSVEEKKTFDLVLMDLTVPGGMGGKEAVAKILEINKDAKVIVLSGYSSGSELSRYQEWGFSGKIAKPFTMSKLKAEIEKHLA